MVLLDYLIITLRSSFSGRAWKILIWCHLQSCWKDGYNCRRFGKTRMLHSECGLFLYLMRCTLIFCIHMTGGHNRRCSWSEEINWGTWNGGPSVWYEIFLIYYASMWFTMWITPVIVLWFCSILCASLQVLEVMLITRICHIIMKPIKLCTLELMIMTR